MDLMTLIAVVSIALAATMTVIVLRMMWSEKQRSAARVSRLAADIHAPAPRETRLHEEESPIAMGEMFSASEGSSRQGMIRLVALGVGVAAAAILLMVTFGGNQTSSERTAAPQARAAVEATAPQPLELLALDHERADDRLTVRGTVRNPEHAAEIDHLTAVVLLFNQQGGFLTSGRAAVETSALEPGAEATFVITVPGAGGVGRYRVSFRTDDQVVPHVDRRHSGIDHKSDVIS
jgi:hypothetical protein